MKNCAWVNFLTLIGMGLFLLGSGCVNPPSATQVYNYQQPSRPILSSEERANLTDEDIDRIIQRGDDAYNQGNYMLAKNLYYEVMLALQEPDAYILNSYGVCLVNLGLYGNAITIFNMALEFDPNNETVIRNIAICRQNIAAQTEAQRQRELEEQRQQQENMQNLIASIGALANQINQQQNRSGGIAGSSASYSGGGGGAETSASSSSSSSSGSQRTGDWGNYQRQYNQREKAVESALDNYKRNPSESLLQSFRSQQNGLKNFRQELNRRIESQGGKKNYISASYYETVNPER
jgi:tetratricopeptide (TPR) repeat protein